MLIGGSREKRIKTAEKYVSRGKVEAAIKEYAKVLEETPKDINILNRLGDLHARIRRTDEAIRLFTAIAEQYTDEGFFVKAIAIYKKIIKLDPTRLEVYEKLAELYHRQGLINEARTQYQVLADYYLKHDNAASAISIYQHMTELEPENPSYHAKLAELYHQQKLTEKAIERYRVIADIMLRHGQGDQAGQVFERAFDVQASLEVVSSAVTMLRKAGHAGIAARVLAVAIERNPEARQLLDADTEYAVAAPAPRPAAPPAAAPAVAPPVAPTAAPALAPAVARPVAPPPEPELPHDLQVDDEEIPSDDALQAALAAAAATVPDTANLEEVEASSLEGAFDLDFQADDAFESLVAPPPDMAQAGPDITGFGFRKDLNVDIALTAARTGSGEMPVPPAASNPALMEADASWEIDASDLDLEAQDAAGDERTLGDEEFELEIDLEDEASAEFAAAYRAQVEQIEEPEVQEEDRVQEEDMLSEAEVLYKYGLKEKALERIFQVLDDAPTSLPAYRLLIQFRLAEDDSAEVQHLAERMSALAHQLERFAEWQEVHEWLHLAGYSVAVEPAAEPAAPAPFEPAAEEMAEFDLSVEPAAFSPAPAADAWPEAAPEAAEEAMEPPPWAGLAGGDEALEAGPRVVVEPPREPRVKKPRSVTEERINRLLDSLLEDVPRKKKSLTTELALDQLLAGTAPRTEAAPEATAPAAPFGAGPMEDLWSDEASSGLDFADESDIDDALAALQPMTPVTPAAPPPAPVAPPVQPTPLEDSGMSWLDEMAEKPPEEHSQELVFEEEDGFFDLAAELEDELQLSQIGPLTSDPGQEQSLDEIIEGFKRGVAENLSPEDHDTHFNLGIAYREMGLLDEAIGEFQLAAKDPRYLVHCCSMLGICFLEKGLPELAVKWYTRGLSSPNINEDDSLALMFDLGDAYLSTGDTEKAYQTFVEVYGINSNYRDISAKLAALGRAP